MKQLALLPGISETPVQQLIQDVHTDREVDDDIKSTSDPVFVTEVAAVAENGLSVKNKMNSGNSDELGVVPTEVRKTITSLILFSIL